jgi:hypothetical protein
LFGGYLNDFHADMSRLLKDSLYNLTRLLKGRLTNNDLARLPLLKGGLTNLTRLQYHMMNIRRLVWMKWL